MGAPKYVAPDRWDWDAVGWPTFDGVVVGGYNGCNTYSGEDLVWKPEGWTTESVLGPACGCNDNPRRRSQ